MASYSVIYNMKELLSSLSKDGQYEIFTSIMNGAVQMLSEEDMDKVIDSAAKSGFLSPDSRIREYAKSIRKMSSSAAFDVFHEIVKSGIDSVDSNIVDMAIKSIKEESVAAISIMVRKKYGGRLGDKPENETIKKSKIIVRIVDEALKNNITKFNNSKIMNDRDARNSMTFDRGISNLAIIKSTQLILLASTKLQVNFMNDLKTEIGEYGIDQKLSASDIPIFDGLNVKNPELLLSGLKSDIKDLAIPILIKEDVDYHDEFGYENTFGGRLNLDEPGFLDRASQDTALDRRIRIAKKPMSNIYFYAISDISLSIGASIPDGYKLCLVSPEIISNFKFPDVNEDLLLKTDCALSSLWVTDRSKIRNAPNIDYEFPKIEDLIDSLRESPEDMAEFMKSPLARSGFLSRMATEIIKERSYFTVKDAVSRKDIKSIIWLKNNFNVLPESGVIRITDAAEISDLHEAGIKFSDSFYVEDAFPASVRREVDIDGYRKLVDMGSPCGITDWPSSAKEALALASRRRTQPAHSALLRKYDPDEVIGMCKRESEFMAAYEAYPERSSEIFPKIPAKEKRNLITSDLDI